MVGPNPALCALPAPDSGCSMLFPCRISGKNPLHSQVYFPESIKSKPWPDRKNHISRWIDKHRIQTEKFPDEPFDPVAVNRQSYTVHTDSKPAAFPVVGKADQAEILAPQSRSLSINLPVLPRLGQQHRFGKSRSLHLHATTASRPEPSTPTKRLHGQALTPLCPAPADDGPTGLCLHPASKTMGTMSFQITRLKGSLAHKIIPFTFCYGPLSAGLAFISLLSLSSCASPTIGNQTNFRENQRHGKNRPAIKQAILLTGPQHVKHFHTEVLCPARHREKQFCRTLTRPGNHYRGQTAVEPNPVSSVCSQGGCCSSEKPWVHAAVC